MEKEILEKYKKAGEISQRAKDAARKETKEGVKILDIAEKVETLIKKEAGLAFPINISINDFAAHYTPDINDTLILKNGDLVKLDIGVHVDGYIADTAFSVKIGDKSDVLIEASEDALKQFLDFVSPEKTIEELTTLVEDVVTSYGVKPVRNLAGHSLDQYVQHGKKSIPNSKVPIKEKLKEDDVIAMEVFTTNGEGYVVESAPSLIYMFVKPGAVRLRESKLILQRVIDEYKTLPFAKRWLKDICSPLKLHMALRELSERGIVHEYFPLREKSKGMVAQTEETIIIKDKPIITTK
jgi:methionyl aminopeptidase